MRIIKSFIIFTIISFPIFAQRSEINDGVDQYHNQEFADAEVNFKKGKEKAPGSFEAHFNLGDAYYKQNRFDESIKEFYSSLELTENPELKAKSHHNIGNSLLKSEKYKESIEAYKNALKINPNDQETKYNLSYALDQLEKQQNQQNQNQDQDKNKDKNQDQDKNKDQNQQNDKKDEQQNEQNKPDQNQQTQQDNTKAQQQKNQISKEEAERILQALKNNEQDIQKKLRKQTATPIKKEKDW